MDSAVRTRPNHYEVLGLSPTAREAEIGAAFARLMSPFHPHSFRDVAAASVAYEVLRDPARRRAYDVAIGLRPEKDPPPVPAEGRYFLGALHFEPPARPVEAVAPPQAPAPAAPEARVPDAAPPPALDLRLPAMEAGPVEWKRPVLVLGGLFLGVAIIGAAAGLWAVREVQPTPAKAEAIAVPTAEASPATADEPTAAVLPDAVAPPEPRQQRKRAAAAKPAAPRAAAKEEDEPVAADQVPDLPSGQVAAQAAGTPAEPSAMPLSDAVIARTLGRIGYACGKVASTSPVEGAGGTFTVSCTSGDRYKAAPVRGRYHFRRWSGR